MLKIIKRTSRILALLAVYFVCAYGYLIAKGFVFADGVPVLSNRAYAKEASFAQKVDGNIEIEKSRLRVKGEKNAPLTMYAYSSMACSHCGDFHNYILPKLERDFISKGKLRFVLVQFPLEASSMRAAKLSYCLPADKYDEFITKLYQKKDWLFSGKDDVLNKYAKEFGMSDTDIQACNDDKRLTSDILLARDNAMKTFGIQGTPSFIIDGADGKELIVGSRNYNDLKRYLNERLGGEN